MVVVGLTLVVMVFQPLSLRLEAFLSFEYKERGGKKQKVFVHKFTKNRDSIHWF